jgi:hypothetical protein
MRATSCRGRSSGELRGEAPTIDLVPGYHRANQSPILARFILRLDELIERVAHRTPEVTSAGAPRSEGIPAAHLGHKAGLSFNLSGKVRPPVGRHPALGESRDSVNSVYSSQSRAGPACHGWDRALQPRLAVRTAPFDLARK